MGQMIIKRAAFIRQWVDGWNGGKKNGAMRIKQMPSSFASVASSLFPEPNAGFGNRKFRVRGDIILNTQPKDFLFLFYFISSNEE